jgi:hypothetical protein
LEGYDLIRKLTRFVSSFAALLSDPSVSVPESRIREIRLPGVWINIDRASDIQALWYLRTDLLSLLADEYNEQEARARLATITEMFRGLVPDNQMPRAFKK